MTNTGQNRIVGIVGRKGSGKSTIARSIIRRLPRVFVFDCMDEHDEIPNRVTSIGAARAAFAWAERRPRWAFRFVPLDELSGDFADLCELSFREQDHVLVIEELPGMVRPAWNPPAFDRILRTGRHRNLSVLWTAQRMSEVSRGATSATDFFVLFSQREPRDLEALADRLGSDVAARVAALPLHTSLVWDVVRCEEIELSELHADLASTTGTIREPHI